MNLTIRQQIFLGYIVMILFTLLVGLYSIWSLIGLNAITTEIIYTDAATSERLIRLHDCILGQDIYEKRALTFGQQDAETQFISRSREFETILSQISGGEPTLKPLLDPLAGYHDTYNRLFAKELTFIKAGQSSDAEKLSNSELKGALDRIVLAIREIDDKVKNRQRQNIAKSNLIGSRALTITIVLNSVSVAVGILFASLLTRHVTTSIERIKAATHSIRRGDFDNLPEIKGADELSDLALSFKEMSVRLKELEAMNLDANPLTKLPGNLAIEKELLTRLNETQKFSFCLADLDNFKAFNDRYGYARGSDVIKWMGEMLSVIKKDLGTPEDFLGHIGGDDFVIICSPDVVQLICDRIVEDFDKGIVNFYDPEDLKKGFIVSLDRNDKPTIFGIMTISVAVVNTDRTLIREPKEVALKVTELKQYAKTFAKSIVIMDRRRIH